MSGKPDRDWSRLEALERLWLDPDWDTIWGHRERREPPPTQREREPEGE